jgi:hypothetical protein|tara:strand:- start:2470 stop:2748 length:279 start_codon:yes stop_codon:yes gene_type:complete
MDLKEFEAKRNMRGQGGTGVNTLFVRNLLPLTPTLVPLRGRKPEVARSSIMGAWAGSPNVTPPKTIMGGKLRTSVIDGEVWIVWYPPISHGV